MNLNHLLLTAALLWIAPTIDEALAHSERLKPAKRAAERLQTESGGTLAIEWNAATAAPGLLTGFLTKPSTDQSAFAHGAGRPVTRSHFHSSDSSSRCFNSSSKKSL
jgi:hypothetical protein